MAGAEGSFNFPPIPNFGSGQILRTSSSDFQSSAPPTDASLLFRSGSAAVPPSFGGELPGAGHPYSSDAGQQILSLLQGVKRPSVNLDGAEERRHDMGESSATGSFAARENRVDTGTKKEETDRKFLQMLEGDVSTVHLQDAESGEQLKVKMITKYKYDDSVFCEGRFVAANSRFIAYAIRGTSPDGKEVGNIRVIDQEAGSRNILKGHTAPVTHVTFADDNSGILCSCDAAGVLIVWQVSVSDDEGGASGTQSPLEVKKLAAHKGEGADLVTAEVGPCLEHGGLFATLERGEGGSALRLLSLAHYDLGSEKGDGEEVSLMSRAVFHFDGDKATALCFSPSGRYVAVGTEKGLLEYFDVVELKKVKTIVPFESRPISSVHFVSIDGAPPKNEVDRSSEETLYESAVVVGTDRSSELKIMVEETLIQTIFIDVAGGEAVANHVAIDPSHSYLVTADLHRNRICLFRVEKITRDGLCAVRFDRVSKYVCSGPVISFSIRNERADTADGVNFGMDEQSEIREDEDVNGAIELYAAQKQQVSMLSLECKLREPIASANAPSAPAITPEKSALSSLLEAVSGQKKDRDEVNVRASPVRIPRLDLAAAEMAPSLLSPNDMKGERDEPLHDYGASRSKLPPPIAKPVEDVELGDYSGAMHSDVNEGEMVRVPSYELSTAAPAGVSDMGRMASVGNVTEDMLDAKFDMMMRKLEAVQQRREAEEREKFAKLLETVSQTVLDTVPRLVEQQIHREMKSYLLPTMERVVGDVVEKKLSGMKGDKEGSAEAALKPAVEKMKKDVSDSVVRGVSSQMRTVFKSEFANTLLPGVEAGVRSMFNQVNTTLENGIQNGLQKPVSEFIAHASAKQEESLKTVQAMSANIAAAVPKLDSATAEVKAAAQVLARSATSASATPTQPEEVSLDELLQRKEYNQLFDRLVNQRDSGALLEICSRLDPRELSEADVFPLSQPVLLCVVQRLSYQLEQDLPTLNVRLDWMKELLPYLEGSDSRLAQHIPSVMMNLRTSLDAVAKATNPTPKAQQAMRMIVLLSNSIYRQPY